MSIWWRKGSSSTRSITDRNPNEQTDIRQGYTRIERIRENLSVKDIKTQEDIRRKSIGYRADILFISFTHRFCRIYSIRLYPWRISVCSLVIVCISLLLNACASGRFDDADDHLWCLLSIFIFLHVYAGWNCIQLQTLLFTVTNLPFPSLSSSIYSFRTLSSTSKLSVLSQWKYDHRDGEKSSAH